MKATTEKELAEAIESGASSIEIYGDLARHTIIMVSGRVVKGE